MRKILFALTAILIIFFLMEPLAQVAMVKAIWPYSHVFFYSPVPSSEMIYQNTTLPLNITVGVEKDSPAIASISCSLDGKENKALNSFKETDILYSATDVLANLAEGNHTLMIYAFDVNGKVAVSEGEIFTVDTTFIYPSITTISPLNQTYSTNEVPLIYSIDAKITWSYYSIDDAKDVTFNGNITLTDLSEGSHKIKINALYESDKYSFSKYTSQTTYFTVNSDHISNPLTIDSQTSAAVSAIVAIAIVLSVGLLVYHKKHKRKTA